MTEPTNYGNILDGLRDIRDTAEQSGDLKAVNTAAAAIRLINGFIRAGATPNLDPATETLAVIVTCSESTPYGMFTRYWTPAAADDAFGTTPIYGEDGWAELRHTEIPVGLTGYEKQDIAALVCDRSSQVEYTVVRSRNTGKRAQL